MNVYEHLCWYDKRNPLKVADPEWEPREKGCPCDNCLYGNDSLAMEIIRLRAALRRLRDNDWIMSDRMDAVRDIAREALSEIVAIRLPG